MNVPAGQPPRALLHTAAGWTHGHGPYTAHAAAPAEATAFYVNDFSLRDPQPWRVFAHSHATPHLPAPAWPGGPWREPELADFAPVFAEVMSGIRDRTLTKAVPVSVASAALNAAPGPWLHARLMEDAFPPHSGHAFLWDAGEEGFGGLTPEMLFQLDGRELRTMALAGTTDAAHAEELLHRPKLAREHAIVVDELCRRLAPLGTVHCGERELVALGSLFHLRTALHVTLREEPRGPALNDLIQLLHPTPALGVSPRTAESMARLHAWRGALGTPACFGAPFGIAWPGGAAIMVAIRGFFWEKGTIHLPAGCGLVAGSDAASEWAEMELKRAWVRRSFQAT